jgi:hypothetical protein
MLQIAGAQGGGISSVVSHSGCISPSTQRQIQAAFASKPASRKINTAIFLTVNCD